MFGVVCSRVLARLLSVSGEEEKASVGVCVRTKGGHCEHLL